MPTLAAFAPRFMAYRGTCDRASEIASKESILRVHLIPAFGDLHLDDITSEDVALYQAEKENLGLARSTVMNHLAVLSAVFSAALEWGLIDRRPSFRVTKRRGGTQEHPMFLSKPELKQLLEWLRDHDRKLYILVLFAVRTGLRMGELRALRWVDVQISSLQRAHVRVHRNLTEAAYRQGIRRGKSGEFGVDTPKSGRERTVPLPRDLVVELRRWREENDHRLLFPGKGAFGRDFMSKSTLEKKVRRSGGAAGLENRVHMHLFRHTYASHLVMGGVDIRTVQKLLGHASVEMTMRYAHVSDEHLFGAVQVLCESP